MNKLRLTTLAFFMLLGGVMAVNAQTYTITDSQHDLYGTPAGSNLSSTEVQSLCPDSGFECAVNDNDPQDIVEWSGPSFKF